MGSGDPILVPEWYRVANGGSSPNANSNRNKGSSSHLDEHSKGLSSRNRLFLSGCGRESPCSLYFATGSLSSPRCSSRTNGPASHDKDSIAHSRHYSSFAKSSRSRNREKDFDLRDTDRPLSIDSNSFIKSSSSRTEKDNTRYSNSAFDSGRRVEAFPVRRENDSNSIVPAGGTVSSGNGKISFDRNFPSLGAEENQAQLGATCISSPSLCNSVKSLPIGASSVTGVDGQATALAEVPVAVGNTGSVTPTSVQAAHVRPVSTAVNILGGLNMAEALAQAPSRLHTASQLSLDTSRIEQLTLRKCKQLIPVVLSTPKTSSLSCTEKSKSKVARIVDSGVPSKGGHQSSLQLVNNALHAPAPGSDISKASQTGNLLVLNRERNGSISHSASSKGVGLSAIRAATIPKVAVPVLKNPIIKPNTKAEFLGNTNLSSKHSSFGEKRLPSQAQNRVEFFNSLRKKTAINCSGAAVPDQSCCGVAPSEVKSSEQTSGSSCASETDVNHEMDSCNMPSCGLENGNGAVGSGQDCHAASCDEEEIILFSPEKNIGDREHQRFSSCWEPQPLMDLDEKQETAFLRSLGWEEDAGEEALTPEEIAAFVEEYQKLRPSSRLSNYN